MKKSTIITLFASLLVTIMLCFNGTNAQPISTGGVAITLTYGWNGPAIHDKEVQIDDGNINDWDYTDANGTV